MKCRDCKNLFEAETNPYPVCDFYRNKIGGLKAVDPNLERHCRKFMAWTGAYPKTQRRKARRQRASIREDVRKRGFKGKRTRKIEARSAYKRYVRNP